MGGFLGALAPIGQTLSGQFQVGAMRQQQQANRDAFGKALENLPQNPEYDMMRQMWKAGASPEAVTNVLGGPIGEALQKEYQKQQWNDFVGPGGIKNLTPDKIWEGVGRGVFTPEEGFKYNEDLMKYQAEMMKARSAGMLKTDPKFNTFLALHGINTPEQLEQVQQDPKAMEALRPEYEQFAGLGKDSTKLQRVYHPETGTEDLEYVPKSGPVGQVVGGVRPPVGGNPIAVLHSAEIGMQRSQELMKSIANPDGSYSNIPMKPIAELQRLGIKPPDNYAHLQDQLGQVFATLNTMIMRAGGFRNPAIAAEWMGNHVPRPTDSPAQVADKLSQWFAPDGLLYQYRVALGANLVVIPTKEGPLKYSAPAPTDPFFPGVAPSGAGGATPPPDLEPVD